MAFERANWHSGLTYKQTCSSCRAIVMYKDDALDFRPWYADGFVSCPRCGSALRHSEAFAVGRTQIVGQAAESTQRKASFCTNCGKAFAENDVFCSGCGKKR